MFTPYREFSNTAARTSNLIKNPPKGGIPLIEKIKKAKIKATIGSPFFNILKEIKYFVSFPEYIRINHIKKELKM